MELVDKQTGTLGRDDLNVLRPTDAPDVLPPNSCVLYPLLAPSLRPDVSCLFFRLSFD